MKLLQIIQCVCFVILTVSCSVNSSLKDSENFNQKNIVIRNDFKKYFNECHVNGSVVIYDNSKKNWILSDTIDSKKETLPASTFKIINLLIALETRSIQDEYEVVKWPGKTDTVKYGFRPDIYHDMTVKEAFEVSAGWVFVELAKKIGKTNYKKYLIRSHYGNLNLSQTDADFWNFGNFGISPLNQVEFIKNLYTEDLPFSKRNMEIVKSVMISEKTEDFTIRSKTGWTRDNGINTGWWVGSIENKQGIYFFATRLLQDRQIKNPNFGACRKQITKTIFKDLNILK
ncbi:penicillin-binding transpeptidase domain-containing protein [Chryseobacterium oncorhynchi]|uniref:Penicillin binding protein transpeptidase domain-containing protein n=1 Tax=Chryseobacterium oncorhynchi TaxID=741074 RepID=A0A316WH20_9FLAO|nr:penicillin-binding transpeptidase domain-containing protein [Chryseobacterium oncorhynchi]PWN60724.1 penicillin binding protein transpeptidase domain-containing protein [Chryseobacterium oncorhynchi]